MRLLSALLREKWIRDKRTPKDICVEASFSFSFSFPSVLAFTMSYHLRDRIPRDYAGMHEGQHVDDDQDEFQDRF